MVRQRLAKPSSRATGRAFESLIFRMDLFDNDNDDENVPVYDPIRREHLWILLAAFRVDPTVVHPENAQLLLTNEDLLNTAGPGCYYCEIEWHDQALAMAPCTGPDD